MAWRVFDRTYEHRTAWPKNKSRAFKYRWRRFSPNQGIKRQFAHNHHEARFDALGIRQELPPYSRRGPIGAHQDISLALDPSSKWATTLPPVLSDDLKVLP